MSREISNISETRSNRKDKKETNKKDKLKKISKVESNNEQKINENTFFITTKNKKNNEETEMTSDGKNKRAKNSHEPKAGLPANRRPTLLRG